MPQVFLEELLAAVSVRGQHRPKRGRRPEKQIQESILIMEEKKNYTYILECGDGSLYTGWTNNLDRRVKAHSEGKGGKYTRSRLPVKLIYHEEFATKEEAMRREYEIKHMTREEKLNVIHGK